MRPDTAGAPEPPRLHVVLYQPEIPQNTGNIGRLCALTCTRLHLIHPLGFSLSEKAIRRSGLDYWPALDVVEHIDWEAFAQSALGPNRLFLFTTKARKSFWDAAFAPGDGLLFGRESAGCPEWLHEAMADGHRLTIPQDNPNLRSLNLSTSVGIAVYEALRQLR